MFIIKPRIETRIPTTLLNQKIPVLTLAICAMKSPSHLKYKANVKGN